VYGLFRLITKNGFKNEYYQGSDCLLIVVMLHIQIPDPLRCGKTMGVEMVVDNYELIDMV
jgi:hypothetical protein